MITILGASGFIGSAIAAELKRRGVDYYAPDRNELWTGKSLGHVIFCIGLTADFRQRPFDTIEAHVCKLKQVLQDCDFVSLTYLSSTRIYRHNIGPVNEESVVSVDVSDPFDIFNSSKLTGELLALNCGKNNIRIVRLSNVYGNDFASDNFIISIIKDAVHNGKIVFHTSPDSSKDYLSIKDAVDMLVKIALYGKQPIYNLASGVNIDNGQISLAIAAATGCAIEYDIDARQIIFPVIQIDKIVSEFSYKPSGILLNDLKEIIRSFKAGEPSR